MLYPRFFVVVALIATSVNFGHAQGRSGRDRDVPRPGGAPPTIERRAEPRAEQAVQQQVQRRAGDESHRSVERHAAAADMAARAAARGMARDSSKDAELRRFAHQRGIRPELVAEQAKEHADIHAAIAAGRLSGKPLKLSDEQRSKLKEVFGDADLLEPREGDLSDQSHRQNGHESASADRDKHGATLAQVQEPTPMQDLRMRFEFADRKSPNCEIVRLRPAMKSC